MQQDGGSTRLGHVRWTICAMLFFATSINYMDRQVIALLKPTLQHTIGLTELNYGYIVDAFQAAYAIGLLVAGRLVDKIGTRIGYILIMGVWSLSAMGHALANTALEFGFARFFLGIGESGNFPAAIKTIAEWFPQSERSLATGIFNSGANVGAILAPLLVPWVTIHFGWRAAFLTTGIFSALWILWWWKNYRKPTDHPTLTGAELRHIYKEAATQMGPSTPWVRLLGYRQTWAFSVAKFLTDPIWWFYLFWLPSYFSTRFHLDLSHLSLPLILIYNMSAVGSIGGGWLPAPFRKLGFSAAGARLVFLRMFGCARLHHWALAFRMGGYRFVGHRRRCAPGLVGQPLHHCLGYVSAHRRRFGHRYRQHGRFGRWLPHRFLRGTSIAANAQLYQPLCVGIQCLPSGAGLYASARAQIAESGVCRVSLPTRIAIV
jgi:MFS transporter, ACS family, aldohexuronate transporter